MKKLYTWGGKFSNRNITVSDLIKNKGTKKYIQTTATNAEEALAAKEAAETAPFIPPPTMSTSKISCSNWRILFSRSCIRLAYTPHANIFVTANKKRRDPRATPLFWFE